MIAYSLAVDLRTVKEIRVKEPGDREIKEFDRVDSSSEKLCVSIHYGTEFVLKYINFISADVAAGSHCLLERDDYNRFIYFKKASNTP